MIAKCCRMDANKLLTGYQSHCNAGAGGPWCSGLWVVQCCLEPGSSVMLEESAGIRACAVQEGPGGSRCGGESLLCHTGKKIAWSLLAQHYKDRVLHLMQAHAGYIGMVHQCIGCSPEHLCAYRRCRHRRQVWTLPLIILLILSCICFLWWHDSIFQPK